ncbi:MAG: hypothetical protein HGA86_05535, partial [Anaerolineaceae bacterium]|nr:hypothetical protein [Anaerolineaceae bacterium]
MPTDLGHLGKTGKQVIANFVFGENGIPYILEDRHRTEDVGNLKGSGHAHAVKLERIFPGNILTLKKYFPNFYIDRPNLYVTHSFGIDLVVITKKDNKVILVKRNNLVARSKNKFTVSVQEGMQYPLDLDEHGRPSFTKTAV